MRCKVCGTINVSENPKFKYRGHEYEHEGVRVQVGQPIQTPSNYKHEDVNGGTIIEVAGFYTIVGIVHYKNDLFVLLDAIGGYYIRADEFARDFYYDKMQNLWLHRK